MSLKDIDKLLSLQTKKIVNNVKVVKPNDIGMNYILRLDDSLMTRKSFVPRIAISQATSEDRTLPRVVGSPYLLGCLMAIADMVKYAIHQFADYSFNEEYDRVANSFYIHSIDFEYGLKPNNSLVFDAKQTEELWLVTYNKETIEYKAKKAGELIVKGITILPANDLKKNRCKVELYIKVNKEDGFYLTPEKKLKEGYYNLVFYFFESNLKTKTTDKLSEEDAIYVGRISEEEFNKVRKNQTSLESLVPKDYQGYNSKLAAW